MDKQQTYINISHTYICKYTRVSNHVHIHNINIRSIRKETTNVHTKITFQCIFKHAVIYADVSPAMRTSCYNLSTTRIKANTHVYTYTTFIHTGTHTRLRINIRSIHNHRHGAKEIQKTKRCELGFVCKQLLFYCQYGSGSRQA